MAFLMGSAGCRDLSLDQEEDDPAFSMDVQVVSMDTPFEIGYGQRVILEDSGYTITFSGLTEDNRCLWTAQCIQAGRAGIVLTVADGQSGSSQLVAYIPGLVITPYTVNDIIQFGTYRFQLLQVNPYPEENREHSLSDYVIMLQVEPLGGLPTTDGPSPE